MGDNLEVRNYSINNLEDIIKKASDCDPEALKKKSHLQYFEGYCTDIGVKTIVIEHEYIDHDYLEDYSAYYVRCFESYKKSCTRLHFFDIEFGKSDIENYLEGSNGEDFSDSFKKSYLGFVVLKPLPQTFVGRTCLKTYPCEGRRYFPITRENKVNLFGVELEVESLAFQEQDKVVAACATSALWSVFQGTGIQFQHSIPSPVEITRAATDHALSDTRVLPNDGLSIYMMANAIRNVGLEPYYQDISSNYLILKSAIYAYLRCEIPMIMGVELYEDVKESVSKKKGEHAVAVTGYSLGGVDKSKWNGLLLRSSKIDRIYVHDDQVGPFARMTFDGMRIITSSGNVEQDSLWTSWLDEKGDKENVRAIATLLLIPLYHKIRIPLVSILTTIYHFNAKIEFLKGKLINGLQDEFGEEYAEDIEWDIYLTTNNKFKSKLLNENSLPSEYRRKLLMTPMPKYLWIATAFRGNEKKFDLIFDATDIEQGSVYRCAVEYDMSEGEYIRMICKLIHDNNLYFGRTVDREMIEWFLERNEIQKL